MAQPTIPHRQARPGAALGELFGFGLLERYSRGNVQSAESSSDQPETASAERPARRAVADPLTPPPKTLIPFADPAPAYQSAPQPPPPSACQAAPAAVPTCR